MRVVMGDDGEPMWVAKDLVEAVGNVWNGPQAIGHVPEEWKGARSVLARKKVRDGSYIDQTVEMTTLREPGVYLYLNRSDSPHALPMQKWIAGDVLPAIRKHGIYATPQTLEAMQKRSRKRLGLHQVHFVNP